MKTNITPAQLFAMPLEKRFRLFVQWLGNQPEDGRYTFADCQGCAMWRFAQSLEGVGERTFVSANSVGVTIGPYYQYIQLVPISGATQYALFANVFGYAYKALAPVAGLPRRAHSRTAVAKFLARFLRHKHALAA